MSAKKNKLPINSATRNAVWSYPRVVQPRFHGAPTMIETTRTHEMPDIESLPEESDIEVEMYGGAVTLRLRGDLHRIYIERFEWVAFRSDKEARAAFISLWRKVGKSESAAEVESRAQAWLVAARQQNGES